MPKHTRPRHREDLPRYGPIELLRIVHVGSSRYCLDFRDGVIEVGFVLQYLPQRGGVVISREFSDYFHGRSSGTEALRALSHFAQGEAVKLPIAVTEDGFTDMGG